MTWLSTLMAMFGRFFITYAMNTGTQITFEVVPTELRGQGNALANVFGQLGMFFSPYIVYSVVFHEALPFLILTVGSFLGAAVSALLPEQYSRVPPLISICVSVLKLLNTQNRVYSLITIGILSCSWVLNGE